MRPAWLLCGSDVLFEALDMTGVAPEDVRRSVQRQGYVQVRRDTRGVGGRLFGAFGTMSGLHHRVPAIRIHCYGQASYSEEIGIATLAARAKPHPETVLHAARGERLSAVIGPTGIPALDHLDPIVRSIRNAVSAGENRLEAVLTVGWRTFAPMPEQIARQLQSFQGNG